MGFLCLFSRYKPSSTIIVHLDNSILKLPALFKIHQYTPVDIHFLIHEIFTPNNCQPILV